MRRDAPRRAIQQSFFASFNRSRTLTHHFESILSRMRRTIARASTKILINFSWQIFANGPGQNA